jgi:RND family efflux transporter MFP subunit
VRTAVVSVLAALAALAGAAGCGRGAAPTAPPPPEVRVVAARLGTVPDHREYVGNVRAVKRVEVRARVRGYLLEQRFEDGRRVAEGDVLFRIDPSTYEVALAEARGQLARSRADADVAEREFQRARDLFASNVASRSTLDERRATRDARRADVASAEAAVRGAELNLSYCTVRAPLAGRIGRGLVDVGNLVGESGQDTVLAEIVQEHPIYVYFAPTEGDRLDVLREVREGRIPADRKGAIPVQIRLGDGTPYPNPGVVDYVAPTVEPTRGTVTVRALVPNPDGALRPGEFVRVTAILPDVPDAVLVPERAVLQEQASAYVLVVKDDGSVQSRDVVRGIAVDGWRQLTKGLAAGERVVVDGVQNARPGAKVTAKPADVAAPPQPSGETPSAGG